MADPQFGPRVTIPAPSADRVVSIIVQNWRMILLSTAVMLTAAIGFLMVVGLKYEVSARMLIKLGREHSAQPVGANESVVPSGRRTEDIASEVEILGSQFLIERVIADLGEDFFLGTTPPETLLQKVKAAGKAAIQGVRTAISEVQIFLGLTKRLTPTEQIIAVLQASIAIEPVPKSDVLVVSMTTPDPDSGKIILDKLLLHYVRHHLEVHRTPAAHEFFEEESASRRDAIDRKQKEVNEAKQRFGAGSAGDQQELLADQHSQTMQSHAATLAEFSRLEAEVRFAREGLANLPAEQRQARVARRSPAIENLDVQIVELQARRESLLVRADPSRPTTRDVRDLDEEIARLAALRGKQLTFVTDSETGGVNKVHQDLESELQVKQARLKGLTAQLETLSQQGAEQERELSSLREAMDRERRQERELALLEDSYMLYAKRLEEVRVSQAMDVADISNVSVISPPLASVLPVWPRKKLVMLAALLVGLGGSTVTALVLDLLRPAVFSRRDVAQILGAPVLARISETRAL